MRYIFDFKSIQLSWIQNIFIKYNIKIFMKHLKRYLINIKVDT